MCVCIPCVYLVPSHRSPKRALGALKRQPQAIVSCSVDAGSRTWLLCKCSYLQNYFFSPELLLVSEDVPESTYSPVEG